MKAQRSIKNILLDLVQVKLGLYSIVIGVSFSISVILILRQKFQDLFDVVIALTDVEEQVMTLFRTALSDTWLWIGVATFLFVIITLVISIAYTHRLVGPTVAFERQIKSMLDGDYKARVKLRQSDKFTHIADALNHLARKLDEESNKKEQK